MSEDQTPDETDEKEGWFVDQTIHINLPSEIAEADLIASLTANRTALETLKSRYWKAKREKKEDDREKRMYRNELSRRVTAIEALKDKLALKGSEFELSELDREHPEAAYRRLERLKRSEEEQEALEREQFRLSQMDPIERFFHNLFN